MKWIVVAVVLLALLPLDPLMLGCELVMILYGAGVLSYGVSVVRHLLQF